MHQTLTDLTEFGVKLKKKAIILSLTIGITLFFVKIAGYWLTGSAAILSDALESIVNIIASAFAFYSLLLTLRPPNKNLPYGYGKIEYFSAGFEGALIVIAALFIMYYGVKDIIIGPELEKVDIGILIIAFASIVNLILGLYLIRSGKKTNSLILVADGKHILTDSITSIAAFAALILILLTDYVYFDPIVAILIAVNILWTGFKLMKASISGLMNKADKDTLQKIADILEQEKFRNGNIIDIHQLRYWKSGDKYFLDFHVAVPADMKIEQAHKINEDLQNFLREKFNTTELEIMIHMDPCKPPKCPLCGQPNCEHVQERMKLLPKWTIDKITGGPAYEA
jgi:cation diffusion facilitator family transporter